MGSCTGSLRKASVALVLTLMNSVAEGTMDFIAQDPANAKIARRVGFEALWRMVASSSVFVDDCLDRQLGGAVATPSH
jgi:hypothetical protein